MSMKYEKVERKRNAKGDESTEAHPAFGQIYIGRIQHSGTDVLYGSSTKRHPTTIMLEISQSERIHHNSRDRYYPARRSMVSVELSANQFADMLTNMNMGEGVPCTIRRVDGKPVPYIPDDDMVEMDRICESFKEGIDGEFSGMDGAIDRVSELLEKKTLNKSDREEIRIIVGKVRRFSRDHAPHAINMFAEAALDAQVEVKKEVDSFMRMAVDKAGVVALSKMTGDEQVELLEGDVESDKK